MADDAAAVTMDQGPRRAPADTPSKHRPSGADTDQTERTEPSFSTYDQASHRQPDPFADQSLNLPPSPGPNDRPAFVNGSGLSPIHTRGNNTEGVLLRRESLGLGTPVRKASLAVPMSPAGFLLRSLELRPHKVLKAALSQYPDEIANMLRRTIHRGNECGAVILLPHMLKDELEAVIKTSPRASQLAVSEVVQLIREQLQEVVVGDDMLSLAFRCNLEDWEYIEMGVGEGLSAVKLSVPDYLKRKERLMGVDSEDSPFAHLEIDMGPFNAEFPMMVNNRSIGQGVNFLNRHLSSYFFTPQHGDMTMNAPGKDMLVRWLSQRKLVCKLADGNVVTHHMIDTNIIQDAATLAAALARADRMLEPLDDSVPASAVAHRLRSVGLVSGWGCDVGRIRDLINLASEVMQGPSAETLEAFLSKLPCINTVVIMTPHGYFAQRGVLGLPDTGGQVVYILDQVRALEAEMCKRLQEAGLPVEAARILVITRQIPDAHGTTCGDVWEPIAGCETAGILRVPFRDHNGKVLRKWISRFEVYPYVEQFVLDVEKEVLARLGNSPDLVIGNYTDGNLVASLLCDRMGSMQANIAHALEMTKYPDANLKWQKLDPEYHFSCQFLADLLSMNHADFIITSTFQEIAGKQGGHSVGQYEAHRAFTMPGMVRVLSGINVFDPRFNIVSPGADETVYYPYSDKHRRLTHLHPEIEELVWGTKESDDFALGSLDESRRKLPVLFSMARLDRVKNLTGLAEMYSNSPRLQSMMNLVIVGGVLNPDNTTDREEKAECEKMHNILASGLQGGNGDLRGKVRWIVAQRNRVRNGELYRVIADTRGAFVQPALFEAFGLTVVEAMTCGLPTFATCHGGPSEVIKHGKSGFQIDPYHLSASAEIIADACERFQKEEGYWEQISDGSMQRIQSRYTWRIYASRLMDMSRVYSFWRHATDLERRETKQYLTTLYTLLYRSLMAKVPLAEEEDPTPQPRANTSTCHEAVADAQTIK